jgi:phage-related protein
MNREWQTRAPSSLLGRIREKSFQAVSNPGSEGHGCCSVHRQLGGTPPSAKAWKGQGSGVYELIEDHRGNTYRAVYTVRIADRVHVLHAFQKKSKSGIKTPREDINLVESRLKTVLERYRNERN